MARYGLLIDVSRCIGCSGCVVGCKNWHGIPGEEEGRIRLQDMTTGVYPQISRWVFPLMCMQCDYPPCVSVCRYQASYVGSDGIVAVDKDKCVGCELCTFACPYGARVMRNGGKVADSCDFCIERIREGVEPYCVSTCPTGAFVFGDIDDPQSEIFKRIKETKARALKKKFRTKPKVFYAGPDGLRDVLG